MRHERRRRASCPRWTPLASIGRRSCTDHLCKQPRNLQSERRRLSYHTTSQPQVERSLHCKTLAPFYGTGTGACAAVRRGDVPGRGAGRSSSGPHSELWRAAAESHRSPRLFLMLPGSPAGRHAWRLGRRQRRRRGRRAACSRAAARSDAGRRRRLGPLPHGVRPGRGACCGCGCSRPGGRRGRRVPAHRSNATAAGARPARRVGRGGGGHASRRRAAAPHHPQGMSLCGGAAARRVSGLRELLPGDCRVRANPPPLPRVGFCGGCCPCRTRQPGSQTAAHGCRLPLAALLQSDHFPGCQNMKLTPLIEGAPNFRQARWRWRCPRLAFAGAGTRLRARRLPAA